MASRSNNNTTNRRTPDYRTSYTPRRYKVSNPVTKRSLHRVRFVPVRQHVDLLAKIRKATAAALPSRKAIAFKLTPKNRNRLKNPSQPRTEQRSAINGYVRLFTPQTLVGEAPRPRKNDLTKTLSVCAKRGIRKQVLHALNIAGGKVGSPRFTPESMISCK